MEQIKHHGHWEIFVGNASKMKIKQKIKNNIAQIPILTGIMFLFGLGPFFIIIGIRQLNYELGLIALGIYIILSGLLFISLFGNEN